jgi:ribokinase
MTPNRIAVLGSLNMDLVVRVERIPAPGETLLGNHFETIPGGKGANQAYAATKLATPGTVVRMAGRIGGDVFGERLKANLSSVGTDVSHVHATDAAPTGIATITVEAPGQNAIVVAPGANATWTAADTVSLVPFFDNVQFALFQLETPLAVVAAALQLAKRAGAVTILDPAPAQHLPPELLALVDYLTPNETEAAELLGRSSPTEPSEIAASLLALGPRNVVLKLGSRGSFWSNGTAHLASPAFPVTPIDTTAAGDTFNAAFAVALAEGRELATALAFANAAAGLSTTKAGAQTSVPTRDEVDVLIASR